MRVGRGLMQRLREWRLTEEEREMAKKLRLDRETARLQNRQAAVQAESRHHSRNSLFGGGGQ